MIELNDKRWREFEGGYRTPYDASIALKKLEQASTTKEADAVLSELLEELHHQGDVGLASYFSVPHIIRIAKEKKLFSFNIFGLVATIEIERHKDNPKLPTEFEAAYLHSLQVELPELIKLCVAEKWDITLASTILSALAVSKGHIDLAEAISKMEDEDLVKEFLENF
jgi:hypothetical protein